MQEAAGGEEDDVIINLHRTNTNNVGDLKCSPVGYFDFLRDAQQLDILAFKQSETPSAEARREWLATVSEAEMIIVGGGGLLGIDFFEPGLAKLFEIRKPSGKVVLWGAGHNAWVIGDWRKLKFGLNLASMEFDLLGVRDFNQGLRWVPCVSCMSPLFDTYASNAVTREVGLYVHKGTMQNRGFQSRLPGNIEILANDAEFEEALEFISKCDLVLTDSYHGAYWATLLGKRVVAFPSSSKFYDLKHAIPLCAPEDWQRFALLARNYPEALAECREANLRFALDVLALAEEADAM